MREFLAVCYLFSPLLVGLAAHGCCIKFGWLESLARPIDGGRRWRGRRVFGANKTYRGLAAVASGTALGFGLQTAVSYDFSVELIEYILPETIALGFIVGLAAMLSELPNSFIKRQLDIAPGAAAAEGWQGALFYIFDQVDFLIGSWLVLAFVTEITAARVFYSFVFLFIAHQALSALGYLLGMRKTAR